MPHRPDMTGVDTARVLTLYNIKGMLRRDVAKIMSITQAQVNEALRLESAATREKAKKKITHRDRFEKWARKNPKRYPLAPPKNGVYPDLRTQCAYEGYLAAKRKPE